MKKQEELASKLLKDNPEKIGVFITSDMQAFFNKDAAATHANSRKLDKPKAFFREGVSTPQQDVDTAKALEDAVSANQAHESNMRAIEKVVSGEEVVEVNADTNPIVAGVVGLKERLFESEEARKTDADLYKTASDKVIELEDQLQESKANLTTAEDSLKAAGESLKEKDQKIAELEDKINALEKNSPVATEAQGATDGKNAKANPKKK